MIQGLLGQKFKKSFNWEISLKYREHPVYEKNIIWRLKYKLNTVTECRPRIYNVNILDSSLSGPEQMFNIGCNVKMV